MPGSVLTKVDRASMAHGLEARPPFLDEEVVALARRVPPRDAVRGRTGKWILREAARPALPPEILGRRKHGFSVPLAAWLRGPLAPRLDAILRDSPCWTVLERSAFRRFAEAHRARRGDHAKGLWGLIVLDAWMRRLAITG
jgi:asparagine synthase (glutamine-hydrolysing)